MKEFLENNSFKIFYFIINIVIMINFVIVGVMVEFGMSLWMVLFAFVVTPVVFMAPVYFFTISEKLEKNEDSEGGLE